MKVSRAVYIVEDVYEDSWELPTCPNSIYEVYGQWDDAPTTYKNGALMTVRLNRTLRTAELNLQVDPDHRIDLPRRGESVKLCVLVHKEGDYTKLGFWCEWEKPKTKTIRINLMGERNEERNSESIEEVLRRARTAARTVPGIEASLHSIAFPAQA